LKQKDDTFRLWVKMEPAGFGGVAVVGQKRTERRSADAGCHLAQ